MALPTDRDTLIEYCLRQLGKDVIKINVSQKQCEDRIDDALQYFSDFHFDGAERIWMPHQITQEDIDHQYIPIADPVISVVQVVPIQNTMNGVNMWDIRYQLRLNDLYTFTATSVMHYDMVQQHLALINWEFWPQPSIEFNRHQSKLFINMDWKHDIVVGEYMIIECYRVLDPVQYPNIYNDRWLKRYATALIKRQWGTNLTKFGGITMPGNVTLSGETIMSQALEEIKALEEECQTTYQLPPQFFMG